MKREDTTIVQARRIGRAFTPTSPRSMRPAMPMRAPIKGEVQANPRLKRLAELHGIQTSYEDMTGRLREASPEVLAKVLESLGLTADTPRSIEDALRQTQRQWWDQCVEPVMVAWHGRPLRVKLRLGPDQMRRTFGCHLRLEDGTHLDISCQPHRLRTLRAAQVDGRDYVIKELTLPAVPLGYHRFEYQSAGGPCAALIIAAPLRAYVEPEFRTWGLFLPMYALRANESNRPGHLGQWRQFGDWVASLGGRVAGTLPLLAAYLDAPVVEPSPYSPASRLFWNEFYLDLGAIPEMASCPQARRRWEALELPATKQQAKAAKLIDYRAEAAQRRPVLERLAAEFFEKRVPERWRELRQFITEHPGVEDYARFRAAGEQAGSGWPAWPEPLRAGKLQAGDYSEAAVRYHLFAQWQAHAQMRDLLKHFQEKDLTFYLDLPLGVHPDSYDAWRFRQAFALKANAGAPPDPFFTKGQDWGFSPLHPHRVRQQHYGYVIDYLRFQLRHTGLLRLDHIMGLHRLYWVPKGFPASEGAYVSYEPEEFYAILCLESNRHKTMLIGENLGTVPPAVNAGIKRHGIREMYVLQYEVKPDSRTPVRPVPAPSLASLNTHDMAPFAAFLRGKDIDDRARLGLLKPEERKRDHVTRRKMVTALAQFLRQQGFLKSRSGNPGALFRAVVQWLAQSPTELVLINLEDLWSEIHPQNVPGTSTERPNWRRKMRYTLPQVQRKRAITELLSAVNEARGKRS